MLWSVFRILMPSHWTSKPTVLRSNPSAIAGKQLHLDTE